MGETGSKFVVEAVKIKEILPHPNADKLEIAVVYGFNVVVSKGMYKAGDMSIYVPVDSILPQNVEDIIFGNSKVQLNKHRVRAIKIRGMVSYGLLANPESLSIVPTEGVDYKDTLGITKYQPTEKQANVNSGPKSRNKPKENPYFRKYNGINNIKWYPDAFTDQDVVIQLKLHGTHVRFGKAPFVANTLWKKIKKFFRLTPSHEYVYGSNNVELTNRGSNPSGFYDKNIYLKVLSENDASSKVKDGEFVHGEIIGPGIQKGYTYGLKNHRLVIFDVRVMLEDGTQRWLNPDECEQYARDRGFNFVPVLYKGQFNREILELCTSGYSDDIDKYEVREGCVVKHATIYDVNGDKNCLKSINPDYLLDYSNTDEH